MEPVPDQSNVPSQFSLDQAKLGPLTMDRILESWKSEALNKMVLVTRTREKGPLTREQWPLGHVQGHFYKQGPKFAIFAEIPSPWMPPEVQKVSSSIEFDTCTALVEGSKDHMLEGRRLLATTNSTTDLMFSDHHLFVMVEQGEPVILQPHIDMEFLNLRKANPKKPIWEFWKYLDGKPETQHLIPEGQGRFIPPGCFFYMVCTKETVITLRNVPMKHGKEPPFPEVMEEFKNHLPVSDPIGYLNGGHGLGGLPPRTYMTEAARAAAALAAAAAKKTSFKPPAKPGFQPRVTRSKGKPKTAQQNSSSKKGAKTRAKKVEKPVTIGELSDADWESAMDRQLERSQLDGLFR